MCLRMKIAVFMMNVLKPLLFKNNVGLFEELQQTLIRRNRFGKGHHTRITEKHDRLSEPL